MKEMLKSAVHMIIVNNDNKILLQKRKGSKLWPGYYALPAGHIDEGENQYDALVREAKEELDIEINPKDIINSYVVLRRNFFEIDDKKYGCWDNELNFNDFVSLGSKRYAE